MENQKQWWIPVWTGLVSDGNAKHYRKMKTAIWLFLYLLAFTDSRSGFLKRKISAISTDMGIPRDTIIRWLNILRKGGYITTEKTGRCLHIQVTRWKNLSEAGNIPPQKWEEPNLCGWSNPTSEMAYISQNEPNSNKKPADPIDISINNKLYNIDIDRNCSPDFPLKGKTHFTPRNKQQLLACDLARELHDSKGLPFYLSCTKKYPEPVIRKVLGQVKEVPPEKITKSRAALFNHMIQQYDQKDS